VQPFFKIDILAVDIDFHVFADSNALDLGHSKMLHCVAHGVSLRIENGFLGFNNDVESHVNTLTRICFPTSARLRLYDARVPREGRRECNASIGKFQRRG